MLRPDYATDLLDELLSAIIRSLSFSDVDESDICEWLADNPVVRGIAHGTCHSSDLILRRILEHATQAVFRDTANGAARLRDAPGSALHGNISDGRYRPMDITPADERR